MLLTGCLDELGDFPFTTFGSVYRQQGQAHDLFYE